MQLTLAVKYKLQRPRIDLLTLKPSENAIDFKVVSDAAHIIEFTFHT